jgi:signal transduction histidine kinase
MLASVVAGLVVIRLLVRRLRSMETLAARVAEGDLTVRIGDASGDEIGRLAEQLDRMTEKLATARRDLESHEQQRRQLFADITHELATPLTSIRGLAETMVDPEVPMSPEERSRYLSGLLEESRRLDRLIRDLFELARLEAGATELRPERLDWVALSRNTVERFAPRFREAGIELTWRTDAQEAWIEVDGFRLEQVLDNLLVNALRYVPRGGQVELSLSPQWTVATAAPSSFQLRVEDNGLGIPAEEIPRVFERFYRGTGALRGANAGGRASRNEGSGLGLAIVREIVERHGGTVRAETRVPHGLVISIELPATAPQRHP